ncbi:ABC transporter ATP-binding protein [Streptomyces sp. cg36]|uniref:ABC transporter ATP-binding protein n=1 Tax=Streptomyces sp. cg36 TaxID=3238798 RepID=UPI0034E23417
MLTLERIAKTYPKSTTPALQDVSFSLDAGEVVALIGHNGAGKSTLFDIVAGLKRPDQGAVRLSVPRHDFGWCPQREIIDWSLTVRQNVELGLALRKGSRRNVRQEVVEICEVVALQKKLDNQAETLSGGELRRCQIARAIAGRPRLMLLDEPTTGLDPDAIARVFTYLRESALNSGAALVSTHETSRFADHCTRVIALHGGRVVADAPTAAFLEPVPGSTDLWDGYQLLTADLDGS